MNERSDIGGVNDVRAKRWAVVRIILGTAQMAGAVATVILLLVTGATGQAVVTGIATGVITLISVFLFRILRCGQPTETR